MATATAFPFPVFALGTGGLAGNPQDPFLPTDLQSQIAVLQESLALFKAYRRMPWIDTALHYGAGNALQAIGLALGEKPDGNVTLSIKVGRILEQPTDQTPYEPGPFRGEGRYNRRFDYSGDGVLKAFEQSFAFLNAGRLERGWPPVRPEDLRTIVFIHDPEKGVHGEKTDAIVAQTRNDALPALARLKQDGKIGFVGIGTNEIACARRFVDHPELDLLMIAGRLTLLSSGAPEAPAEIQRDTEGLHALLSEARRYDKKIVAAAPGQSGLLYKGGKWYNYAPASDAVLHYRNRVKKICDANGVMMSAAALQFPLHAGAVAVVCGACSAGQLGASLKESAIVLAPTLWTQLQARGLLYPEFDLTKTSRNRSRR